MVPHSEDVHEQTQTNLCIHPVLSAFNGCCKIEHCSFTIQYCVHKEYRKFPKYLDTPKICCNHSTIWTMWLYHKSNESKRCRWNSKQCRPWSDCSSRSSLIWVCTVCPGISVLKLRIITVANSEHVGHGIRTHMDVVMYTVLTYCATEASPKKGSSNTA